MITVWQVNTLVHKFALVTPDFRLWDFVAGAYEASPAAALDPQKHLRADDASVPYGLRTLAVPDEARAEELPGVALLVYRQSGAGWSLIDAIPIDTLTDGGPLVGNIYIGGR